MAAEEYRIPITIEINESSKSGQVKTSSQLAHDALPKSDSSGSDEVSTASSIASISRVLSISNKLLSASGNNGFSSSVRTISKALSIVGTAASGNYATALVQLVLEVAEVSIKSIQQVKQDAITNNNANVNNIRLGRTMLQSGSISSSKDIFGRISYNVN